MNEHLGNFCDYTDCEYCYHFICDNKYSNDCQRNKDKEKIMASVLNGIYDPAKEVENMVKESELQEVKELCDN